MGAWKTAPAVYAMRTPRSSSRTASNRPFTNGRLCALDLCKAGPAGAQRSWNLEHTTLARPVSL